MCNSPSNQAEDEAHSALLTIEVLCNALVGPRLSAKELVTRAVALAALRGHWRFAEMTLAQIARRVGVSRTAISRRMLAIPKELSERMKLVRALNTSVQSQIGRAHV